MLERNRGARRDHNRKKKVPALRALEQQVTDPWYWGRPRQELERQFLRN